ncbi:class I SAM-dependent methyltransferase [Marinactinospora rubrisoli]|uniref:Class I SAM-dependent methyltransferase n=1 Tax=Marinactinospora rubrisoli TaxID=2715399 RepID=A0ABW2KKR0_9ACTN
MTQSHWSTHMSNDPSHLREQAARTLLDHPWIGAAGVATGGTVEVAPAAAALAVTPVPGPLIEEYLDHWGEIYDWTYRTAAVRHAADLDLSGWTASDTGRPLPAAHMTEWVERTVDLVLETSPRTVLELGCGTGLLAHRLSGRVLGYVGADVAETAVGRLAAAGIPGAAFVRAAAHEAGGDAVRAALDTVAGADGRPDCVLLNSVTQCFPDLRYLRAVLLAAVELVAPGGTVVVGDVRHAGLLDAYCRWVERAADPDAAPDVIADRAAARAQRDDELLFDPPALAAAVAGTSREVRFAVRAKTLTENTELTRYRFDAVLTVDPPAPPPEPGTVPWTDLAAHPDPLAALADRTAAGPVRVTGIPNAALLDRADAVTAAALRAAAGTDTAVALDPADPTALEVHHPAATAARPAHALPGPGQAHEPLHTFVERRLAEAARAHLRRHRPAAADVPVRVLPDAVPEVTG